LNVTKTHYQVPNAAPAPATARYSHCVKVGEWLYVTGQLPVDPDNPDAPLPGDIKSQTELSFRNLERILAHVGYEFADTVFARVYLANFERDYPGFNEVYLRYYDAEETLPGRTTVGVAKLGRDALVEVDLVLYREA
jgi:reactive intermediate/imine deaminase